MHLLDIDFYCCFFFKQKTAYEMRISDWSSDACSSDLSGPLVSRAKLAAALGSPIPTKQTRPLPSRRAASTVIISSGVQEAVMLPRSEEHTSELQSLMRISYAVFCLKKKKTIKKIN